MSDLSINCGACNESTPWQTSPNIAKKGKSFDVNRRAVYNSIETGSGYEGLSSFCAVMNMPCLSRAAYYKQVDVILEALECEATEELKSAGLAQCQSVRLPPMWPGFDSRTRRHMWAEFVGSLLCSERFFSGYSSFPLSSKNKI